ncbi:MAG: hypothetical protein IJE18_07120 [Bacteroidaceae bacterium]|nr:hypothetical protein [Bacteroidaceae bacterium]
MTHSEQLYDALINKGYTTKNIGDRDTFLNKMQDKGNRRILYDYISKRGDFRIGNYDNYEQRLASDFSIPQPLQENASLALKHPIYKANPMLRGYSFIPDSPEAVETGQKASALTFDNIEPAPATPDILQRNAQQISASAISPSASNSEIGGVAESRGGYKPQDPLQEAVAQDLIGKASSQAWQRDTEKLYRSEKERLQALYNRELAKTSGRQFSSSYMGYNPSADTAMSRDASLYAQALQYINDAEQHMDNVRNDAGLAQGVSDAVFDIDTLTLGLEGLFKNATLKDILDKADADQQLTQAEEALLNAALYKQFTEAAYTNGRWYNVGKGIGEQVPYMLEFALSGGTAGALTKGANKAIGKAVTKYINNLALKNGGKIANRTARNLFTRGTRALGNTLSQLPGGIMRATVQVPLRSSVYNDIIERQIGTLGYSPSASNSEIGGVAESRGGLQYTGRIGADNTTDAIAKGLTSGFITNLTESIGGEGIQFITNKIGGLMGKGISALSKDFRSPRWYNHLREGLRRNGLAQFISASSLQGPIAEYGEEILDQTLNAIFVGDSSLDPNSENYVFDTDNLINTAITTGATSLFMGAAGGIASAKVHRDVNKAYTLANQNLRTLQYSDTEINALNNIATSRPQEASKWVSSITRTMRTLATRSAEIESTLSPEARTLIAQPYTEAEFNALSPYDQQAISALYEINNRFNELTIQRDYVVAGTNYNAFIKGLKESVAPQAEAAMANINANALRDSDYTVQVKFKGQDGYLVTGTADITDMPDGSTIATLPAGNIYQVRTKAPDGQWVMQQAIAEDIQPISVTPTQQLIDETTARIYKPVEDLISAEHAQAQAEVLQSQPTPDTTTPAGTITPDTQQATPTEATTPAALDAPVAPADTTPPNRRDTTLVSPNTQQAQSTEPTPVTPDQLSDDDFDTHIGTLTAGDAIQAITERRGAEEADQYASWRKGILTKERDKAQKALTAKIKPFDPARYPNFAQMKQEERKYNEQLASHRNKQQQIIDSTTAEIADIDRYLANRNRQIAAEREAENPLRNGIAQAVEKQPINTLEQYIARYIALGGRLRMTDQFSNGLAAELGITHGSQEHRELLSILSNNEGMTPEQLAQDISENIEPEYRHLINGRDTQDIRNAIIDTIAGGVTSRRRAYDFIADINQRATDEEQRYIDEQELQAEIDADTEQAIRDYEELLLSSITPHDLTIIDAMAGDYWDELLDIQQYEQEAYNDYDTPATSTAPRNTQQGAESTAIQSSTQQSNTTPISQDSQDTATIRPATPQQNDNGTTRQDVVELQPINLGQFGPIYNQFRGKAQEAIAFLSQKQDGEAIAALNHPEIGDIDLVWGNAGTGKSDGYGLAKLVKYHPEVLNNLQEIINDMHVTQRSMNRVQLESDTHQAAVRLTWNDEKKNWLLTAFEKKNSASDNTTDTDETSTRGKQNDTATLQNTVSTHKDTTSSLNNNNLQQKIAQAEAEVNTNPTEAQKEAGNYKKGHIRIGAFDITIEQPQGSIRRGVDANGKAWESKMHNTYGYIRGTEGVDGDHIDVFLANDMDSWNGEQVFVIDQYNEDGTFDEHKVMLGFNDIDQAYQAYLSNYEKGWEKKHNIVTTATTTDDFNMWIDSSHRKTKPFADYKSVKTTAGQATPAESNTDRRDTTLVSPEPSQAHDTKERQAKLAHIASWQQAIDVPIVILHDISEVDNQQAMANIQAGYRTPGWFTGGTVYIYLPHILDARDIDETIMHECIAHYGIPRLFATQEQADAFYDEVWNAMPESDQYRFLRYPGVSHLKGNESRRAAADEYIAHLAEQIRTKRAGEAEISLWKRIVSFLRNALRRANINLQLNDTDLTQLLLQSLDALKKNNELPKNNTTDRRDTTLVSPDSSQTTTKKQQSPSEADTNDELDIFLRENRAANDRHREQWKSIPRPRDLEKAYNAGDTQAIEQWKAGWEAFLQQLITMDLPVIDGTITTASRNKAVKMVQTPHGYKVDKESSAYKAFDYIEKSLKKRKKQLERNLTEEERRTIDIVKRGLRGELNNTRLRAVSETFDSQLQQQIDGTLPAGHIYNLGMPSPILRSAGLPNLPIELAASRLTDKSMQENHPFDIAEVRGLVDAIQDPHAIFRSATHIGSFVVLTEIQHGGRNFVVAIEANRRHGRIEVNSIRSIHYRNSNTHIANWIEDRLLEYAHKERMSEWFSKQRYNSADVRKLFRHTAKIVQNFENPKLPDTRFRIANQNQAIFVSNARQAVENIRQDRATPEQWLAMLQKNGGIKAGEDKWLGLSDWLKNYSPSVSRSDIGGVAESRGGSNTITRQQILDFINSNAIRIEEVHYTDRSEDELWEDFKSSTEGSEAINAQLYEDADEWVSENINPQDYNDEEEYEVARNNAIEDYIEDDLYGRNFDRAEQKVREAWEQGNLGEYTNPINSTRLDYTTPGLTDNHEIALTIPDIEPYNEYDDVHFGDAGGGRAVAWIRFGDTRLTQRTPINRKAVIGEKKHNDFGGDYYTIADNPKDFISHRQLKDGRMVFLPSVNGKYIGDTLDTAVFDTLNEAVAALQQYYDANPIYRNTSLNVLVIDEIQSKRHQDGREKGYRNREELIHQQQAEEEFRTATREFNALRNNLKEKYDYNNIEGSPLQRARLFLEKMSDEDRAQFNQLLERKQQAERVLQAMREPQLRIEDIQFTEHDGIIEGRYGDITSRFVEGTPRQAILQNIQEQLRTHRISDARRLVPDAPFDKNWHELAFKRMLRYAAENGYDHLAWTTGVQQAERYDIGNTVHAINRDETGILAETSSGDISIDFDSEGNITTGQFSGNTLSEVFGKETAVKILNMTPGQTLSGDNLRIGGEGMKAFYDRMLPSFVSKYVKKWGSKVQDITLPDLGDNGLTMHSVEITPDMRESVMQGQTMFRSIRPDESLTDYARAVVANSQQSTAPAGNNTSLPQNLKDRFSFRELEEQTFSAPASDSAIGEVPQGEGVNELSISPEEQDIIDRAKANGTYLLAPNGRPTNLTPRQWVQVRTRAFKEWFGDWLKQARVNKLRYATDATITGNEIEITDNEKQNKKNALEYGKTLQGEYTNKDTGNTIQLQRGRKNGGINEVLQHNYKDAEHLQSIAAIPQIIVNSIFVEEVPNKDTSKNPDVVAFQHYVCGLKIGNTDYTVHSLVAVDKKGDRYYDHNLIHIEKIKLLDIVQRQAVNGIGFGTTPDTESTTNSDYKYNALLSILQTNASKIVDENGEPMVATHYSPNKFTTFDTQKIGSTTDYGAFGKGFYFSPNMPEFRSFYGNERYDVYLNIKNPLILNDVEKIWQIRNDQRYADNLRFNSDKIQSEGYDGTVYINEQNGKILNHELIAFSPNQIKSATDNIGTFDSNNPDTRFRSASPLTTAQQVARQELPRRIEQHTAVLAKRLGVPITVLHSNDDLRPLGPDFNDLADWLDGNIDGHTHRMAGMFDAQSNKLFIFAHNIARTADPIAELESTITHEVVTHYGLRQLLGEQRLNTLLSDTWSAMPQDLQLRWGKYAMNLKRTDTLSPKQLATLYSSPAIQHKAAEEYIAHISESGVAEPTLWQHICATFRRLLRRIGLYSYKPTEADIRYILSQSYSYLTNKSHNNQQSPIGTDAPVAPATATTVADTRIADSALSTIEQATAEYAQYLDNQRQDIIDAITPAPDDSPTTVARKVMFRSIGGELVTRDNTELEKFLSDANRINNAIAENDARHKHTTIAEAHYDSMQRLHNLLDDLRKQGALIDERFDPWLTQNQARSRAQAETNIFDLTYRQPLYEAIAQSIRALFPGINTSDKAENAKGYSHLSLYAQARTAVERQAIKSAQARAEAEEKGEEYKERDFGGLAGIQEAIFGLYSAIDDKVEAAKGNIEKLTEIAIENGIPTVQEYIDNAEAKLGSPDTEGTTAHQLWTAIRTISAYQLTYGHNAGLTSRAGYQTLTYGHNIDGLLRDRYNMQVKQIKDNPGSYDNVTDYDNDGNATGTRKEINDNARIALNKLNQEYAEAIDAVPMPGKNGSWQTLIDTGWLTEEQVNGLHRYYMYYMPLKGHAELTAEDIVDYENKTPRNLSKIKAVEGHSHLAKDPFNQLILDTHGAIQNAEQNRWRTHLYNILTNNPNPSQYVVEQRFYKIETKSDGSKEYVPYGEVETINGVKVFIPGRPTAEELANGTALSYNNRFTRAEVDIPITNDQRKEHSVTVVVDGEAYSMFFYDKRIADAINGTNIKRPSDWLKYLDKLQALNRLYAGFKTSLNPTFTLISNLPRDWAEMVSNNLIEHGLAHAVTSFIYRVRATRVGDVQAALRKHQAGELLTMDDATTDVERYVVEFFNNGGSVNITQLPDYDTAKVELMEDLNTYMRTGEIPQGNSWARAFNNMAERVELAPRLATYIASRKLGHNISQSINDAKEATVNFDRKGSLSGIMGMFQLFYNASAQSVRRQIGLARRHPVRFAATYATIGLLSPLNCIMLSYIASLLLGDDDDNLDNIARNYFAINPELRRRYFIILIGDNYIRIPMAVNYLPYVTLGDVLANWRLNPNYRANSLKDTLDIVSALLDTFVPSMFAQPIGFAFDAVTAKNNEESANAWRSLAGSLGSTVLGFFFGRPIEPLMQSLGNYNFMGSTLFDMPYDKNSQEPAYLRARQYTQPVWVWASHLLNDITGGNDVHAGWLNIAPEQIENVMTVFGGYGEYGENVASLIGGGVEHIPQIVNEVVASYIDRDGLLPFVKETLRILYSHTLGEDEFKKSIPMLSRLYGGNTNERYEKAMQSMFYDDMTALAGYEEYRKNAITPSTRADFDRTYSPDEQRYFADLATMETIAKRIRKEIKAATPEGESPKYHEDERLKQLYNLANEQFHSLASGSYTPVDAPLYTYKYIEDALTKTPYRMADGTYRLIDYSREKKKAGDDNYVSVFDLPDDTANALIATYEIYRKAKNGGYSQLPSGYYPGMALDEIGKAHEQVFSALVNALDKQYNTANITLSTDK